MSALDGVLEVGDLVWQQMYSPTHPSWDSTIEERIANGELYGERKLMLLVGIHEHYDPTEYSRSLGVDVEPRDVTRWWLVDPDQPNAYHLMSWVESDWCVLTHAATEGALW